MISFIKKYQIVLGLLLVLFVVAMPVFAATTETTVSELVPCGEIVNGKVDECDYNDFLQLLNNIIEQAIILSFFVATAVFAYAGYLYMTTGIADQKTKAKSMLWKVFIGYICIASAWLVVDIVLEALLNTDNVPRGSIPVGK